MRTPSVAISVWGSLVWDKSVSEVPGARGLTKVPAL
jgi:hypothetical protein